MRFSDYIQELLDYTVLRESTELFPRIIYGRIRPRTGGVGRRNPSTD